MGKNCVIDYLKTDSESVKAIIAVEGYGAYSSPIEMLNILILEERVTMVEFVTISHPMGESPSYPSGSSGCDQPWPMIRDWMK